MKERSWYKRETGSNIRLFISTFGRNVDWIKGATPIEVGAAGRENIRYHFRDDTGDNISDLNPWWGELTGLYWIWKNYDFTGVDIVGFGHWGKYLKIRFNDLRKILIYDKEASWIAVTGTNAIPHDYPEDIEVLEKVISEKFPQYADAWAEIYNHDGSSKRDGNCHGGELFYTTTDEFMRYCEFVFSILFETFEREGKVERPRFHKRYIAFLGERLLSVYLEVNKNRFLEHDMFMYGDRGIRQYVKALIPSPLKQTDFYRKLSLATGNGSSYGKKWTDGYDKRKQV